MEGTKKLPITQEDAERLYMEAGTPIHRCEKVFETSVEVVLEEMLSSFLQLKIVTKSRSETFKRKLFIAIEF